MKDERFLLEQITQAKKYLEQAKKENHPHDIDFYKGVIHGLSIML